MARCLLSTLVSILLSCVAAASSAFDTSGVQRLCKSEWRGLPPLVASCVDQYQADWAMLQKTLADLDEMYRDEVAAGCLPLVGADYRAQNNCIHSIIEQTKWRASERQRALAWQRPAQLSETEFVKIRDICMDAIGTNYHGLDTCMENGIRVLGEVTP